jgi:hypothetical protein
VSRACDGCTACCTVMAVRGEGIDKPLYTPCDKACAGTGCTIYETRPKACEGYSCLWLMDDGMLFKDAERPDKSGLLFEMSNVHREMSRFQEETGIGFLVVREVTPGAFESYWGQKVLKRLSKKALIIRAYQDGRRVGMGPPEKVRVLAEYTRRLNMRESFP